MNESDYTNFPGIWKDIGFDQSKNILYKTSHINCDWDTLFALPSFQSVEKIFAIEQEHFSWMHVDKDPRIQAWDSTVSDHPRIHTFLFWFEWVREIESYKNLCNKLLPIGLKDPYFVFDSLLGCMRPHRQFARAKILHSQSSKFILGMQQVPLTADGDAELRNAGGLGVFEKLPNTWIPGGDFDIGDTRLYYNDKQWANFSCFVPYKIYNDSWYSIVCETLGTGEHLFFTEKTAKPLIAGRLFVLFGQHRYLENLRKLGYKTFDGIIDESYDQESNDRARYELAWQQVEFLMTQDPIEIYKQCQPILEHNTNLIKNTMWNDLLIEDMIRVSSQ